MSRRGWSVFISDTINLMSNRYSPFSRIVCRFASPLFISPSFYKLHCTPGRGRGSRPRKPSATFFEFSPFSLQTAWRGAFVDEIFCNMKLKFMLNFCLLSFAKTLIRAVNAHETSCLVEDEKRSEWVAGCLSEHQN